MGGTMESKLKKSKQGNIYDAFVKNFFGRVVVFADFLRYYGNKKFVAEVNLSKVKSGNFTFITQRGCTVKQTSLICEPRQVQIIANAALAKILIRCHNRFSCLNVML
jgi:hypothetical protein